MKKILKKKTLEHQFMPAVLEITETPPNPLGRIVMYVIMAVFAVFILLACFTHIDIIAVAPGKIISSGKIKLIQPLKSGVVVEIYVRDGQLVKKDAPLVKVKFEDSESNRLRLEQEYLFAASDVARYTALLEDDPMAAFVPPKGLSDELLAKNKRLLQTEFDKLKTQLQLIDEQVLQAQAEKATVQAEIKRIDRVLPNIRERVRAQEILYKEKLVAKMVFLEWQEQLMNAEESLAINQRKMEEVDTKLQLLSTHKTQEKNTFRNDMMYKLQETSNREELLRKELANAVWVEGLTDIKAPEDGIIQELEIHTIGGIVTPAQTLMKLVPANAKLEVDAMILNKDVGFVREEQDATIKIDSFPYTKYGTIDGKILTLSKDAIETEKLGLVYNARLSMGKDTIYADGKDVKLSAGMAVTVEIKTGKRRMIEYILAPFVRYSSEAMRER